MDIRVISIDKKEIIMCGYVECKWDMQCVSGYRDYFYAWSFS